MQVFIMRHGEAESGTDADMLRELTPQGREDVKQMGASYAADLSQVDSIWASPYVRTQETAQLLSEQLVKPMVTQTFLTPNGNPADVLNELEAHRHQTVLIVSHQPLVGVLVDGLAGLETGRYRMGTASLAYLSGDTYANRCCELRWLYQPASTQVACD